MTPPSIFAYFNDVEAVVKVAEEKQHSPAHRALQAAKTVGAGLLGLSGGTILGYGAGRLAENIHGGPIPAKYIAPISGLAGAGFGMTYGLYKKHEAEELRRVLESQQHGQPSGVPAK